MIQRLHRLIRATLQPFMMPLFLAECRDSDCVLWLEFTGSINMETVYYVASRIQFASMFRIARQIVLRCVIDDITCNASGYTINYQVTNLSANNINEWMVSLYPPVAGVSLGSGTVSSALAAGATSGIQTLTVTGASPGDQLCFAVSLHELDQYGYCLFCCTSSEKTCITLPSCDGALDIFPNPSNQNITIESKSYGRAKLVRIFDLSGKMIMNLPVTQNVIQLSIKNLNPGSYIVQMIGDDLIAQGKFIKQ